MIEFTDLGDNAIVREIWNGAWTTLTLGMVMALTAIALDRARILGWKFHYIYADQAVRICVAVSVFVSGSGIRACYIWILLHCQNFNPTECAWIEDDDWIMSVAGLCAIIGGLCTIRVISPRRWRQWPWVLAGLFAISIPLVYYTLSTH